MLLDSADLMEHTELKVVDRDGRQRTVRLTPLPFYDPHKRIPRGLETADV